MKARLFLILIFTTLLVVLLTNGSYDLIPAKEILVFDKKITLNTELIISLIVLLYYQEFFFIGVIERLFFSRRKRETKGAVRLFPFHRLKKFSVSFVVLKFIKHPFHCGCVVHFIKKFSQNSNIS